MKKKLISILLSAVMIAAVISGSAFGASAVTTVTEGDWVYAVNSGDTYLLYSYKGSDTSLKLPSLLYGKAVVGIYSGCFSGSSVESVTIPHTYFSIGDMAFNNCTKLSSVNLPGGLTSLGNMAFAGCTSLESVDFTYVQELTEIPYAAFSGCASLAGVRLPAKIATIGESAFENSGLASIVIPESVTTLEENAFSGCALLESITLPSTLVSIPDGAFSGCTSLTGIDLPNTLETIGASAFENISSLGTVFIPESVSSIGANAFYPEAVQGKVTLTCYGGTYAEDYCKDNFVASYVVLDRLSGDANLDGELNIMDVTYIQKYCLGLNTMSYRAQALADVNGDGEITIRDATAIQLILVGA